MVNMWSWRLKLQLIKEREEKAEALGEAERQSVAIQEKLKKEIHSVVEETEKRMTKTMEEQLHSVLSLFLLSCFRCLKQERHLQCISTLQCTWGCRSTEMLFQVHYKEPPRPLSSSRRCRIPQIFRYGFAWEKMTVLIFFEGDKSTLKSSEMGQVGKWCLDWNSDRLLKKHYFLSWHNCAAEDYSENNLCVMWTGEVEAHLPLWGQ